MAMQVQIEDTKLKTPKYMSREEHRQIARALERHHAIFERVWSMSRIRYSDKLPTAGVRFNRRGDCMDMFVNPEFWNSLTFIARCFVIAHECMHIALDHGTRSEEAGKKIFGGDLANIAQDIVINHALVERYGFYRDDIDPILPLFDKNGDPIIDKKTGKQMEGRKYCWVDTVFPDAYNMPTDESYEYYYVRLKHKAIDMPDFLDNLKNRVMTVDDHSFNQDSMEDAQGMPMQIPRMEDDVPGGGGEGKPDGDHGDDSDNKDNDPVEITEDELQYFEAEDYSDDFQSVIDKLDKELSNDEKKKLQHVIEENENSGGDLEENPQGGPEGKTDASLGGKGQGNHAGKGWTFANKMKIKKRKFESIITRWAKKKLVQEEVIADQWIFTNRRFAGIEGTNGIIMPQEYKTVDDDRQNDKIEVWFFQDTSASCGPYKDRFFAIAESMPHEKFNMRLFCFDTMIYETDLESRELRGFGGTHFHMLEDHVHEEIANPESPTKSYPEAIFVVTDGHGTDIKPQKPENWHWILTPGGSTGNIPKACNIHDLANYE